MPTLETDIRKLPDPVKRQRKAATVAFSALPPASLPTSRSTTSATDGQTSPSTLQNLESSATSGPDYFETPNLSSFKPKRKKSYGAISREEPPIQQNEQQGYWNEYDHPEDGSEEEAYFIYLDPNSSIKLPGQDTLLKWAHKTQRLFRLGKQPEEAPLLRQDPSTLVYPTSDGEDSSSSDEVVRASRRAGESQDVSSHSAQRPGYFSSMFGSSSPDVQPFQPTRHHSEPQVHTLLEMIEMRQHEREMTKLRLYATCLVASVVIDIILGTLVVTSRRKERGVVDAGILFGTIANLLLLVVAVASMRTRRERLGWFHQTIVFSAVIGVVVVDILLLRWVLV